MSALYPVILAGGSGERFWPLSRRHRPKQFLNFERGGRSLLQSTADRLTLITKEAECLLVVTAADHTAQVLEHLPDLPLENLLVEPLPRDTAAAVLYAALTIAREDPQAVMGVFPADHRIDNQEEFTRVLDLAVAHAAANDQLVTLGVQPRFPATGYGYIERGASVTDEVFEVRRFTEKPDAATAAAFVETGNFFWNSGMFIWRVDVILQAFQSFVPELYGPLSAAVNVRGGPRRIYPELPRISVDYAILERARNVVVIPADLGWDDLGDWNALERLLKGDGSNVAVGRHVGLDTDGAILYTTSGEDLIATIGLEDVVVVRAGDVTLVVRKDRTQDIKKVVSQLKLRPELERFI